MRKDLGHAWRTRDKAAIRAASVLVPIYLGVSLRIPLEWDGSIVDYLRDSTGSADLGLGDIWYRDRNEAKWRAHRASQPGATSFLFEATYRPGQLANHNEYVVKLDGPPIIQDYLMLHTDGTWRSQATGHPSRKLRTPKLAVAHE